VTVTLADSFCCLQITQLQHLGGSKFRKKNARQYCTCHSLVLFAS